MAKRQITVARHLMRGSLTAIVVAASTAGFAGTLSADIDLAGSWSGGGSVTFSTGSKEKARCRAVYAKAGVTSYTLNATCATASGKVAQTASIRRSGPTSFAGSFYNPDYDLTGSIKVSVQGNSQSITLTSSKATASLRLSR